MSSYSSTTASFSSEPVKVTTVHARGNYKFRVTSDSFGITFTNVRFEVGDGAEFSFNLDVGENIERYPKIFLAATFTGVEGFVSPTGARYL